MADQPQYPGADAWGDCDCALTTDSSATLSGVRNVVSSVFAMVAGSELLPSTAQLALFLLFLALFLLFLRILSRALRLEERRLLDGKWTEAKKKIVEAVDDIDAVDMLKVLGGAATLGAYAALLLPMAQLTTAVGAAVIVLQTLYTWHNRVEVALQQSRWEAEIAELRKEVAAARADQVSVTTSASRHSPASNFTEPMNHARQNSTRKTLRANRAGLRSYETVSGRGTATAAQSRARSSAEWGRGTSTYDLRSRSPSASPPPQTRR
jgi:hypothetical protein